jgi:excisionase family DNA binding protein
VSTSDIDDESTTVVFTRAFGDELARLPAVLTTREAATTLRIGVKEVRALVDSGALPAARFGPRRVIRIAKSALVHALRGRRGVPRRT